MKQKLLLLLALLGMAMSPLLADTQDEFSGNCGRKVQYNTDSANLQWRMDTAQHKLTITGSGQMMDYSTDTKAPWYPWRSYIQTVTFPNGMTTVGSYAFYNCTQLNDIQWGATELYIYQYAFYNCTSLTQISMPATLTFVASYAFYYCSNLKNVTFGNNVKTISSYAFYYCSSIEKIDFGQSPTTIFSYAFYPASSLITIKSKRIKQIDSYAFQYCPKLVNLQLGDSLQSIGWYAFQGCSSLKAVHFPATLRSLYGNSFIGCSAMDTITVNPANTVYDSRNNCNAVIQTSSSTVILGCYHTVFPDGITAIGNEAFYSCSRLQTLVLPEGLQTIGDAAFANCSNLTSVSLPNSVSNIGCGVFRDCGHISSPIYNNTLFVYLPRNQEGVYTIPGTPHTIVCEAFYHCTKLTSVIIPASVTTIGSRVFYYCTSLQSAPLPSGLTQLGSEAFYNCTALSSITIPPTITTINASTFYNCRSLSSIVIPDAVTRINDGALQYCSGITSITLPANLNGFGGHLFEGCSNLRTIYWNVRSYNSISYNSWWDPFDGVRHQITSFILGDSVRVIPANLCYDMTKLTSLSLGCNITKIGDNAFYGCSNIKSIYWNLRTCVDPEIYTQAPFYPLRDSITEFTFGDSVRHIPAYLCHSMSRLHQLYIPERVSSIGQFAFRYLGTMDSIAVHEDNMFYDSRNHCNALIETSSDILLLGCYKTQIPYDITGIGDCAFRNVRNLTSVAIPEDVSFVGKEAFNGCHDMKELSLPDDLATIDDYAFQDCDSLTHITLPVNLSNIGFRAFAHCSGLEEINNQAPTPPVIDETSFSGTTCPIRVPCAYIADYRSAPVWMDFGNRLAGEALYTLTVQPNEYAYGVVSILQKPDCEHEAIVEATPSRGFVFKSWQKEDGTVLSTTAYYSFTLEEDLNLIAVFGRITEGFEDIKEGNDAAVWYDIMGHRVSQPSSGVYIVVTGNETHKVFIP